MIDSLIFDLDGTLIDSSDGIVEAVNYSLRMVNAPEQPAEAIRPYIGDALSRMYPVFCDAPLKVLLAHFQEKAAETVVASTRPLKNVEALLPVLKDEGYRMGIASTKVSRHIHGIIELLSWENYFDAVVGSDDVDKIKPHPEAFHLALEKLGSSPERTVVIGDTDNDVLAAKRVPVRVVAVESPYGRAEQLKASEPDYYIDDIRELPELLAAMRKKKTA